MSSVSNNFTQDCPICQGALDTHDVETSGTTTEKVNILGMQLSPESIAETPDPSVRDRFYHGQCLARWINTKVQEGLIPKEPMTRETLNGTKFYEKSNGHLVETGKYSREPFEAMQQHINGIQQAIDGVGFLLERNRERRVRSRLDVLVREQNRRARARARENRIAIAVFAVFLAGAIFITGELSCRKRRSHVYPYDARKLGPLGPR